MQREPAVFTELGIVDLQLAGAQVDIAPVERDRFSHSHAGAAQEAEQGLVGCSSQGRPQGSGGPHQAGDVRRRVQIGSAPLPPAGDQLQGGHLDRGVDALQVAGKAAHRAEPIRPAARGRPSGRGRPCHGSLNGNRAGPAALEVAEEVGQQAVVALELEPEPAADGQVVGGSLTELAAHHRAPGHGRAMLARAGKSSFAYRPELAARRWRSTWPIS